VPSHQFSLSLIDHKVAESLIQQRAEDGYINATQLCNAAGKRWYNFHRLETTGKFLRALEAKTQIRVLDLVQEVRAGTPDGVPSTWVHPKVALHLAQWLSADFAVQVTEWVHDWMTGKLTPSKLPYHIERHMLNYHKIPTGYFSVLQEMTNRLVAPMEAQGYRLPESMMPDIAHGRMLCKFLRERRGVDTDALPVYLHTFPDGREVEANLYPVQFLGDFLQLLSTEWFPTKAVEYFKQRDPQALAALDKMLMLENSAPVKKRTPRGQFLPRARSAGRPALPPN